MGIRCVNAIKIDIHSLTHKRLQFKAQTNKINADMYRASGFSPAQSPAMFI